MSLESFLQSLAVYSPGERRKQLTFRQSAGHGAFQLLCLRHSEQIMYPVILSWSCVKHLVELHALPLITHGAGMAIVFNEC